MKEQFVGKVTCFLTRKGVAGVEVQEGCSLKLGDTIIIRKKSGPERLHATPITSMEHERVPVQSVGGGAIVGILLPLPPRENDDEGYLAEEPGRPRFDTSCMPRPGESVFLISGTASPALIG